MASWSNSLLPLGLPNSLAFVARAKLVPGAPSPSPITPHPQQAPVPCPALFRVPCSFCTGLRRPVQNIVISATIHFVLFFPDALPCAVYRLPHAFYSGLWLAFSPGIWQQG